MYKCFLGLLCILVSITSQARSEEPIVLAFGLTGYNYLPLFTQFEEQYGIKVETAPQEHYDLKAELVKKSKHKRFPDAFIAPADYTTIPNLPLKEITQEWLNPNISQGALKTVFDGTKLKAIPLISGNHLLLYFNKHIIDTPAKTFSQLQNQLNIIPANKRIMNWSFNSMYVFIPFLSAFDALPVTGQRLTMNTPQMARALEFYWQLPEMGMVDLSCSFECISDSFIQEEYAYIIDGVWAYKKYSENLGDKLGISRLPTINNKPMKPYYSSHALAIIEKQGSPAREQALQKLALFLQSEAAQMTLWQNERALPSNQLVLNEIMLEADENIKAMVAQLDYSNPIPNTPHMAVVWEAMLKGFNRYGANVMQAQESAQLMQHLAQRTIDN